MLPGRQYSWGEFSGEELRERAALVAEVEVVVVANGPDVAALRVALEESDELVGVARRQRLEEDAVNVSEDRAVDAA